MKTLYSNFKFILTVQLLVFFSSTAIAQNPACGTNVPYHYIDLTGFPAGTWISPSHSRVGNCCGTSSPDRCTSFEIVLDPQAVGVRLEIVSGAIPTGSMFYQAACGTQVPVGEILCLTGVGPHQITFCKPGNNQNQYRITSISAPTFQGDDSTRFGCSVPLWVMGFVPQTVTWNTIYPGSPGQYNNLLNCNTGCQNVIFTPNTNTIPYYDIRVCGFPKADKCGFTQTLCDTIRVYVKDSLSANILPNPAKFCQLGVGSGVNLSANPSGGSNPYIFNWMNQNGSTVSTNSTYTATNSGNFTLKIDDHFSGALCPSKFLNIPVVEVLPPQVDAGISDSVCSNSTLVSLFGTVQNSNSYSWSGGQQAYTPNANYLIVNYQANSTEITNGSTWHYLTALATDPVCPSAIDSVQIIYIDSILVTLNDTLLNCFGDSAEISPSISGGSGNYTFLWSTSENTNTIIKGAGNYCLNVSDDFNCQQNECFTISTPTPLTASMSSTDVTVNGGSDGTATAAPSGGTAPYSYLWNPSGATTQTDSGLAEGIYSCDIQDANGCAFTGIAAVVEPVCLGFDANITASALNCFGDSTATALANTVNGTAPFTFLWDDGAMQTTNLAISLPAGTYQVIVEDVNNCFASALITINSPAPLDLSLSSIGSSTVGGNDGSANSIVNGGTIPYSYLWSTTDNLSSISGLSSGWYSLLVTDVNACEISDSIFVADPDCSNFHVSLIGTDLKCFNDNSGAISAQVTGGLPAYAYFWDNNPGTDNLNNVNAGTHYVLILDQALCVLTDSIVITQPQPLSISDLVNNTSCLDSLDGSIDIVVSGGTFPYYYNWSNGATSEDLTGLAAGTYINNLTDNNGCQIQFAATILSPDSLRINSTVKDNACFGIPTAYIDLTVSGGTSPYIYNWSNGEQTEDIFNILGGMYYVSVTDQKGCQLKDITQIYVGQVDSMSIALTPSVYNTIYNISSNGGNDGTISADITGGTGAYDYSWSNGESGTNISGLSAGTYILTITDSNGCEKSASIILKEPYQLSFPTVITNNNDGQNDLFVILGIDLYPENNLVIFNRWGNQVYQIENYNNTWAGTSQKGEELPEGNYFYVFSASSLKSVNGFVEIKR